MVGEIQKVQVMTEQRAHMPPKWVTAPYFILMLPLGMQAQMLPDILCYFSKEV